MTLNASQTATWKFTPTANVRATFSTCNESQDQRTSLYINGDQIVDQNNNNKLDTSCGNGFQATRLLNANGSTTSVVAAFGSFDLSGTIQLKVTCSPLHEIRCNSTIKGDIDSTGGTAFSFTAPVDQNIRYTINTCSAEQNVTIITGEWELGSGKDGGGNGA